ncbi:acyl-CoA--sterol O-acyltransferase 1-like [Momordica charantia]|uniref:Acyl-CoA--sterol O-acyltransferase 1-like n=1 Tax=Momordica charantia TaxID=3673 RepID=A0A6J1DI64_MOMCH|nr:acyl-CoA--sterol O-acyltransferase 1-like [Momordica charantia]
MEDELLNFFKVWFSVWISLCYCYGVGKIIRPGTGRLIFFFPVISLFLYLPINLHSLHLGGLTAFFVAWLANFKLLLFAVDQGPLADPRISIGIFCALASLPIKFNQNPLEKGSENCNGGAPMEAIIKSHHHHESLLNYAVHWDSLPVIVPQLPNHISNPLHGKEEIMSITSLNMMADGLAKVSIFVNQFSIYLLHICVCVEEKEEEDEKKSKFQITPLMATEIGIFVQTVLLVCSSLCFCFSIRNSIPHGFLRFLLILPFFFLFLCIPLQFHTIHLQGAIGFFIGWLGSFKLLLFAFGKGPLCSAPAAASLRRFLAVGSLPIEIPVHPPQAPAPDSPPVLSLTFPAKLGLLLLTFCAIYFRNYFNPYAVLVFYCLLIYLLLEILVGGAAALARTLLGVDLSPYFDEPYLSASLQEFWGRRWNLMTTRILRVAVYDPCRRVAGAAVGKRAAVMLAVAATFAVSGLMHELIYFYMGRMAPTWEVTCFFLLHGVCLPAEMAVKAAAGGRFRLPRAVSAPLTLGFVMVTSFWLFFPQFLRFKADVRMFEEYAALGALVKNVTGDMITPLIAFK